MLKGLSDFKSVFCDKQFCHEYITFINAFYILTFPYTITYYTIIRKKTTAPKQWFYIIHGVHPLQYASDIGSQLYSVNYELERV